MNYQELIDRLPPPEAVLRNPKMYVLERELCDRHRWLFLLRWVRTKDENHKPSDRPFPNHWYLEKLHDLLMSNDKMMIEKSRRMFITWWSLSEVLAMCTFDDNKLVALQSLKEVNAKELIRKCKFSIERIPPEIFYPDGIPEVLKLDIFFPNGSHILGVPEGPDQLCMHTVSLWFCDEGGIQPHLEDAFTGSMPTLEGGGKALIVGSTRPTYFHDIAEDMVGGYGVRPPGDTRLEHQILKGFETWKNSWNGFRVVRLNYTADPKKDPETPEGKAWYVKAHAGLDDRKWAQEYEIDATALAQSLVYPEFKADVHIVEGSIDEIPKNWTIYHTMDPGIDAPTAGLWLAVDPQGDIIFFDEYYIQGRNIKENAAAMTLREKGHPGEPFYQKCDPAAFKRMFTGTTVAWEYSAEGRIYSPANNDVEPGISVVKMMLKNSIEGKHPGIYFFSSLTNLFREIRKYSFKDGLDDRPAKGNDHLMDCLRYACMMAPTYMGEVSDEHWHEFRDRLTGHISYYQGGD